MITRKTGKFR